MSKQNKPFDIKLEHFEEHENGDATYTFDMPESAEKYLKEEGLRLILLCAAAEVDLEDVYDWIASQAPKITDDETEDLMSSPGDKDYEI